MNEATNPAQPTPAEILRRQALRDLKILDTPREERFDRLARQLAAELDTPVAYVALLDGERQWLKCEIGGMQTEMPQELSFCNHTIRQRTSLVVEDATLDPRFASLPLVTGESHIRFYASVPIADPQGQIVGTVCVADRTPRRIGATELDILHRYARKVEEEINAPPMVFVSYAHEDESWKNRLVRHCDVLRRQGLLSVWEDRQMEAGDAWRDEIQEAIERSKVAVLLVSADFLTSDFILKEEVPKLLERRDREGLRVFPVLLRSCTWEQVDWLSKMNLWPPDARPVSKGAEAQIEEDLCELAARVAKTLREQGRVLHPEEPQAGSEVGSFEPTATPAPAAAPPPQPAAAPAPLTAATPPAVEPPPATPPAAEPHEGRLPKRAMLGKFEIRAPIGGRSDLLFSARDTLLGRDVAIKLLPPEQLADAEHRQRFQREARILASLRHPGIATLYNLEEAQGSLILVLQPLHGETLQQLVAEGPLEPSRALAIGLKIASALAAAHASEVAHRGLEPSCVVVSDDDDVRIFDFGIAKELPANAPAPAVTRAVSVGALCDNTSPYTCPERLRNEGVGKRSDVWCFGCLLWLLLTGESPFQAGSSVDTVVRIVSGQPDWNALPAEISEGVRELLRRCLDKQPDARYSDMAELEGALAELLG